MRAAVGIPDAPRISVVVPAYQAAATLPACLAALRDQTVCRDDYEVIVIDDGSTDDTAQVAEQAGADQVLQSSHGGPGAARNAGITAARGEIALFTDADCEPRPDWIAQMLQPFRDPAVVGVKGSYKTRQTAVVARLAQCEFEERYNLLARGPTIDFVDSHAAAFRVSALREVGGFDPALPKMNEDVDLSFRLAERGHKLVFNRQAVVVHRHVATWKGYVRLKARRGYWRMMVYRLHPGKALRDSYTPQVLKLQILLVYCAVTLALAGFALPGLAWGAAISLVGMGLSGWAFYRLVRVLDPAVLLWAPLFVAARAAAFALGVGAGLVGMLFFSSTAEAGRVGSPVRHS